MLPLNEYSRQTYISENAILPGQVHTYFGGSEHNVFRAYRQEVYALSGRAEDDDEIRVAGLEKMFREMGLKSARQDYSWKVAGESIEGTNVYGLLQGPRADATEAMVLIAAWRNTDDVINYSGVALALTLARYFKRWSIWSKDILILIPADSYYSTQAWVSAYHSTPDSTTSRQNITALPIKAGALQAAVAIDYPAGPWGQRFANLDILYDGVNGALPNLDLLNTAVQVASSQMGISCTLHGLSDHRDSYTDRLLTLSKGIMTQSLGHATGPHSAFMPYHVDAITLKTTGDDGWHDEMTLGRTAESLLRSVNNLLEHLHQSFFLYILLSAERFVSIGNYLPAAMVVAGSFTITALALWVKSGKREAELKPAAAGAETKQPKMAVVTKGDDVAVVPKSAMEQVQRKMLLPAVVVLGVHFCGFIPFYWLTFSSNVSFQSPSGLLETLTKMLNTGPLLLPARHRPHHPPPTHLPWPHCPGLSKHPTSRNAAILLPPLSRRRTLNPCNSKLQPSTYHWHPMLPSQFRSALAAFTCAVYASK